MNIYTTERVSHPEHIQIVLIKYRPANWSVVVDTANVTERYVVTMELAPQQKENNE